MTRNILLAIAATALLASCAGTPPPTVAPRGEDRFLIDPRTGSTQTAPVTVERRFQTAWGEFLAGRYEEARQDLAAIRKRAPEYLPAELAEAAIDIREGRLDVARGTVDPIRQAHPDYTAAAVYSAEIAMAEHRTRDAYEIYSALSRQASAPAMVAERLASLQQMLFQELYAGAQGAPPEQAIRMLREALVYNPAANDARILLASRLVAQHAYADARQVIDPVLSTADVDRADVQEVLAEIDAASGRYQEAIARYERLQRRTPADRYARRLEDIKEQWNLANMPPQYQKAVESDAITRADLAVLAYWRLPSVRFAQNLGTPPIAIDVEGIPGREELIRALAIGLYDVDPVTRTVSALRPVTTTALARLAARLLTIRGASCARGLPPDPTEASRAQRILASCRVTDPSAAAPDVTVSGRAAVAVLDQVALQLAK